MRKKTESDLRSTISYAHVEEAEAEVVVSELLIRAVARLRAMKLGRYACTMLDGSTVKIEIKPRKSEPSRGKASGPLVSWEERIAAWLKKHEPKEVTVAQILAETLGMGTLPRVARIHETRVVECLHRLGWKKRLRSGGSVWKPPR